MEEVFTMEELIKNELQKKEQEEFAKIEAENNRNVHQNGEKEAKPGRFVLEPSLPLAERLKCFNARFAPEELRKAKVWTMEELIEIDPRRANRKPEVRKGARRRRRQQMRSSFGCEMGCFSIFA